MNSKNFEYITKDIPLLKKDIFFRSLFSILLLCIFVWQFIILIITNNKDEMSILKIIIAIIVLITALMMFLLNLAYTFKDFKVISVVKTRGRCISAVNLLIKTNKKSFIQIYHILMFAFTLLITFVLLCSLTYTILQASVLSLVSFYMPMLFIICVTGYNSIYHIKHEITIQNKVQAYNGY